MAKDKARYGLIIFLLLTGVGLLASGGYLYLAQPKAERIDWTLTLVGKEGEREIGFEELTKMQAWDGKGGFFTTVGMVNGPFSCKGVLVEYLCSLVGGITPEDCLWVWAPDGYSMVFSYEQVKGDFVAYDPQTMKEVPAKDLKMILMYEQDGATLKEEDGRPLRIAIVSPHYLLTEGHYWVKWVNKIEVRPLLGGSGE
ncbi:MAG: molybdopterin-dependent oxidoreductase [Thermoanaerobacteraceae bacterium]|nr:molybdopterin-dependent oxidoreductase [Thermoanaerobacteraceae bacterium]